MKLLTPPETVQARWALCRACPHFQSHVAPLPGGARVATASCARCGCFLQLKTRLFGERCPEGKW